MEATATRRPLAALQAGMARLTALMATPLVPADYVDLFDPLRSRAALRARVISVHQETRDAATLMLQPGHGWQSHVPGQWIRVGLDVDGVRQWRPYSLTCAPRKDGLLAITVKARGRVSTQLVRQTRPGMLLHLDQACGEFVLPERRPQRSLFISAGSGITPVMGILRHAVDELEDAVVVHSAPTPNDVIFGEELRDLSRTGRIRLVEQHTATGDRLTPRRLAELVPDWDQRETWACGPPELLDALQVQWEQQGLESSLHTERFQPSVVGVAGSGSGMVIFDRSGVTVHTDATTPLLGIGEDAGVLMRSGCRMGICFGCVAPLREGAVRDLRTGAITICDGESVLIQTCVSAAAGDCTLDV